MSHLLSQSPIPIDDNREWQRTPIDWSIGFPRSSQHLSNQLRAKKFNADRPQLDLFDDTYRKLPAEVRRDVDKHNIAVLGFSLSVAQQRAYEAALYLITATGYKTQRIVITPDEWLKAYGVEVRQRNTRDRAEMSSYEREEAFTALASLGVMPWLISYDRMVDGRWKSRQEVATLWQCGTEKDQDAQFLEGPAAKPVTPQDVAYIVQSLKDAERISIKFHDIWFDQHQSFYFYKPAHLYQRLGLAISGSIRRRNRHTHAFIDWIFSEVGRIRVDEKQKKASLGETYQPREVWTFAEELTPLALQLRMTAQVSKRNWSRIRESITDNALLAQQAQIITEFAWIGDQLNVTFNQKTFADLDQYHEALEIQRDERNRRKAQRSKRPEKQGVHWPFPRPVGDYLPTHLKDFKKGQLAELAKIRERIRLTGRQPTEREQHDINFHNAVVAMIDDALVPKPPHVQG